MTMVSSAIMTFPSLASAHQHETFVIGGKTYVFTVGSLNEPVAVDDKTGVDLMIERHNETEAAHDDSAEHEAGAPVTGLEATLKAELIAGPATKTLDLSPVYGKPGGYKAVFIPTVQTTYTYRIFGTIEGTPVNLSFTCNPAGHAKAEDWTGSEKLSDGVTRTAKSGAFGCPSGKADLGFPEPSASTLELKEMSGARGNGLAIAGVALGAIGCALGLRSRKSNPQ